MADVLEVSAIFALNIAVPWATLRLDMRRLGPERLARAWEGASFWSAVVVFGPLCLPFHFTRTRRSAAGLALGVGALVAAALVIEAGARVARWLAHALA